MPKFLAKVTKSQIRQFVWSTGLLLVAGLLALLGTEARHDGQFHAAVFLSFLSLALLAVVSLTLVPRLVLRVSLDFLNRLQFFRFTRRGAFFVLVVVLIAFSSLNTGNNLLILVLATLLAALIVSGLVSNLVLQGLRVSLKAPDTIFAGQKAIFLVTLQNLKSRFPSFALRLRSRMGGGKEAAGTDFYAQEKTFPYVRAGDKLALNLECRFDNRGSYSVTGFEVRTTFPFGFFSRGREIGAVGNIVVYPRLKDVAHLLLEYPQLQGNRERNIRGAGGSLYNIRNYQPGDNARFVHWKSTAKTARLMIKDLASEEDKEVVIVFSTRLIDRTPAALRAFEEAVSCVASLCTLYYRRQQPFTFDSGEFETRVDGAEDEYRTLMEYLARVQPTDQEMVRTRFLPGAVVFAEDAGAAPGFVIDYSRWGEAANDV